MFGISRRTSYKEIVKNYEGLFNFILNNDLSVENYDHPHYVWGLKQKVVAKDGNYGLVIFEDPITIDAVSMYLKNGHILYSRMLENLTKAELKKLGEITEKFKVRSKTHNQGVAFSFVYEDIIHKIDSLN